MKDKSYIQILRDIKDKYGVDYTSYMKTYRKNVANISKQKGKKYKPIQFYLYKKAVKLSRTQEATRSNRAIRGATFKQLYNNMMKLVRKASRGKLDKKGIRMLQKTNSELIRRRIKREKERLKTFKKAKNFEEMAKSHEQLEKLREQKDIARMKNKYGVGTHGEYRPYIPHSLSMTIDEYVEFLFARESDYEEHYEDYKNEAIERVSSNPLSQVTDGYMDDGYIDEENKIIVYTA